MRLPVRLVATAAFSLLVVASAHAAAPTPESIDTLLALTKSERLLDSMMVTVDRTMMQAMRAALKDQPQTPEQQKMLESMSAKFSTIFREEMTYAKLRPLYVRVYSESFTQEEIDGLIAFYRTPSGQALIDKMPVVMQRTMAELQPMMQPMLERMKAAAQQAVEEAKAAQREQQAK